LSWICRYCGKDTSNVDYDYMDGYDHLSCALENFNKKKVMKIKGWEKIHGYTYKGYSIVNPIHNADETMYEATILNLNLPQNPKWELNVLTPKHKWKNDGDFSIILRDDENRSTINTIDKVCMASISIFRQTFEEMIDKMLGMRLTSAVTPNSHSIHNSYTHTLNPNNYGKLTVTGTGGGILTTINSNANNIVWDPNTNLPSSMLMAVKDLQEQIDNLKQINNVNNK
jgi:hydroxyacyl-ACP dehydratase HTD2-like protein with hotdog domain